MRKPRTTRTPRNRGPRLDVDEPIADAPFADWDDTKKAALKKARARR